MDINMMGLFLCCMAASFAGTYAAVLHCFSQWDEEDMYDDVM